MSNTNESYLVRVTDNVIGTHGFRRMKDAGIINWTDLFKQILHTLVHNEMQTWSWAVIGQLVDEIDKREDYFPIATALNEYVTYEGKARDHVRHLAAFHIAVFISWRLNTPGK